MPTTELLNRACGGDLTAFDQLIEPYRRELELHCYRMLGSRQDAEDAVQDTLLAAWQGIGEFEGRSSVRTWLYRIATRRCLNILRAHRRRLSVPMPVDIAAPPPTMFAEVTWIDPYPDADLDQIPDTAPSPYARYAAAEAISLAFVTALQLIPPQQRAVLLLRDVLGFSAKQAALALNVSVDSVNSALKRARAGVGRRLPARREPPPVPNSVEERDLVERLTCAYLAGDVAAIVALFTEDAWLTMPPIPLAYQGRESIAGFLTEVAFTDSRAYRLVPTRANGQLALAAYVFDAQWAERANGLLVLTLTGNRIIAMTRFPGTVLARFGLPGQ
ncbi:RNA polymerase subunit sigma-70 [Nocardia sp. NPDC050793]|uniref:RNA polymerase subunit sigma-70 n=1 Tax=Nocardia sp. NPDC050793 TaxID=3155159 RepID=UPI0033F3F276